MAAIQPSDDDKLITIMSFHCKASYAGQEYRSRRLHVSMMTGYCLKKPFLKTTSLLLKFQITHSSNLLSVARLEVKLGAHVYYIVYMTTTTTNFFRHFSLLANCSGETWYTCVLHHFHHNHMFL